MKIAGRKNDGAWYRTNKWLRLQPPDVIARLKAGAGLLEVATVYYGIMGNLAGTSGLSAVGIANFHESALAMLAVWMDTGIPRQVYSGNLSWDNYVKVDPGSVFPAPSARTNTGTEPVYAPQNAENARQASAKLRKEMNRHRLVLRSLRDIANQEQNHHTNPGGQAGHRPA